MSVSATQKLKPQTHTSLFVTNLPHAMLNQSVCTASCVMLCPAKGSTQGRT